MHLENDWELPGSPPDPDRSPGLPVVIERLVVTDGDVYPPKLGEQFDGWVDRWSVTGLGIEGSLDEVELAARVVVSRLELEGAELGPPIELALDSRLSGSTVGGLQEIRVESLQLRGSGLELDAEAELPLPALAKSSVRFDFDADAAELAPRLSPGGRLRARGFADAAASTMELELEAEAFPTRLLEPWLGADTFAKLPQRDATLDADVTALMTASSEPGAGQPSAESSAASSDGFGDVLRDVSVDVDGTVSWSSGSRTLLHATSTVDAALDLVDRQVRRFDVETRVESSELPIGVLRPWLGEQIATAELADSTVRIDLTVLSRAPSAERVALDLDGGVWWSGELGSRSAVSSSAESSSSGKTRGRLLQLQIDASHPAVIDRTAPARDSWLKLAEEVDFAVDIESGGLPLRLFESFTESPQIRDLLGEDDALQVSGGLGYSPRRGLDGTSRWTWQRSVDTLADLVLDGRGRSDSDALVMGASAEVLPGLLERSSVALEVTAPLAEPNRAVIRSGQVELSSPDVRATIAQLAELLPSVVQSGWADEPVVLALLDGELQVESEVTGAIREVDASLDVVFAGQEGGDAWALEARGKPLARQGSARFSSDGLELSRLVADLGGRVAGTVELEVDREEWTGDLTMQARTLELADGRLIEDVLLELTGSTGRLQLVRAQARMDESQVSLVGEAALPRTFERPIRLPGPVWVAAELEQPFEGFDSVSLRLSLEGSSLRLETTEVRSPAGSINVAARSPIGQLRAFPGLRGVLDSLDPIHLADADSPVELELELPDGSFADVFVARDEEGLEDLEVSGVVASLRLYLDDWARSRGTFSAERTEVVLHPEGSIVAEELDAQLADGVVSVAAPEVVFRGETLDVAATLVLADPFARLRATDTVTTTTDEQEGDSQTASLIENVTIDATGAFEAQLLNRWLAGGVATGVLTGELELQGRPGQLRGRLRARGEDVTLTYLTPYETRIEAPELDIALEEGSIIVNSAQGRLNEGPVSISGTAWGQDGVDVAIEIGGARYRLDYGLSALLRGTARLVIPPDGQNRLTGDLMLVRGLIRRDIDLDRELRNLLLGLPELTGTDRGFAETIDLDLRLRTSSGIRVNNNLADLRVIWTPLDVRGTLAEPLVKGRLEVDPGGRFFAYGQVVQLDRATIEMSGLYGVPPKVDTVTTNSIQDPTLGRFARSDPFSLAGGSQELGREEAVEAGLLDYYGGRLTSTLERSLGGVRLDYDPLLFFGETEPEARLTVSQDLTENVAVGVALNLRQAERRTYLLDLHDFAFAPGLSSQLFTNEERNQGATLQHSIQLRGSEEVAGPRIVEIEVPRVDHIDRGDLLDSLDLQEGDPLREGGIFDLEVEISDYLRGRGYPTPRVRAQLEELEAKKDRERARIDVTIEPGPRAEIDFVGERPSSRARRSIRALYRSDLFEESALLAMQDRTVTVLRGRGFLEPVVEISVEHDVDDDGREVDRVTVSSVGGRKVTIGELVFPDFTEDEQAYLRSRFVGMAARIELALGAEAADRRLLGALGALGYPIAEIRSRALSDDGKKLTVEIDHGPAQQIVRFDIVGVSEEERQRLSDLVRIQRGDRYRADPIARAALTIEQDLRDRSYLDARVVPRVGLADEGQPFLVPIVFEVETGTKHTLGELSFTGGRATRDKWARRLVDLEVGEPLQPGDLSRGRRRLIETGAYSLISLDVDRDPNGLSRVTFALQERPRFRMSYGLRWESDDGLAAVVDAQDRNVFGRGVTLGARGLVSSDTQQARIYASMPRAFGGETTLEAFADVRSVVDDGLITDSDELSLQISRRFKPNLLGRLYGRYREEHFTEEDPDPFFPLDERLRTPTLGIQLLLDKRRKGDLFGSEGFFGSIDLSGAGPVIGGDLEYVRLFGQMSWVRGVGELWGRRLVWAQSYRLGVADSFDQILSRDVRFFAGGEYSVRGFESESLGPFERFGSVDRPAGGEALIVVNQELRFPVAGRFSAVLFLDAGNVWDDRSDLGRDLESSFGLGLRARTGVGTLRFDIARPFDRRELDDEFKIYIGLGQVF